MSSRKSFKMILSIIIGAVTAIIIGVMRSSLGKFNIIRNLFRLKNVGLESVKDILDISELNLRIEDGGRSISWDSDNSDMYVIVVSSLYVGRVQMMHLDDMLELLESEIDALSSGINKSWIRKIIIDGKDFDGKYRMPFSSWNCRVKSSNGKTSRHLKFPIDGESKVRDKEFDAWLMTEDDKYFFCMLDLQDGRDEGRGIPPRVSDLHIVIYVGEERGFVKSVPPFNGFVKVPLENVKSGLCYLTGVRTIGAIFEQYVGWIGEHSALNLDGMLEPWEDLSQLDVEHMTFE